jgi:hypothetical protein
MSRARSLVVAVFVMLASERGRAAEEKDEAAPGEELDEEELEAYRKLITEPGIYTRALFSASAGRGLRFNNPYRLRTQLGDSAESVSATAPYLALSGAAAFGAPDGIQHGVFLQASFALEGVSQPALSLSYVALYRAGLPVMGYGRLGPVLLTAPDPNLGAELALGFAGFFTGALGATAEVVGDLFYGAGTYDAVYTVVPVLSFQAGLIADFEVLP